MQPEDTSAPQEAAPQKKNAISTPAAILTGAAIIALAIGFTFAPKNPLAPAQRGADDAAQPEVPAEVATLRADDLVRGARDAAVVVIEYSDSDCPFCQRFHDTMRQVVADYDGEVAWAYRHFPLPSLHPNAKNEAIALACVAELGGEKAFWPFLDTVITLTLTPGEQSTGTLITIASEHGVDAALLRACLGNKDVAAAIDASIAEAQAIGARGTPFSIAVNQTTGEQAAIAGAQPIESVKATIDALLK